MTLLIPDSLAISARVVQRRNPRAPTIEPLAPYYRLRAPDGRYLNIDGSGFTEGPYRYVGNLRQAMAMRRTAALAADCRLVAVQPQKREA